jgi:AGZA family xanthine/uracil permease-like MFS transporter
MLEKLFQLTSHKTSFKQEVKGGLTTFFAMAYILFVNPVILEQAGMDKGAVFVATCLSAALGCLLMGLLANYPIALAPSMGLNVFFTYTVVLEMGYNWQVALGCVFISGVLFVLFSVLRIREMIIDSVPLSIRQGIATGIGLFLAVVSLKIAGIVVINDEHQLALGNILSFEAMMWVLGVTIIIGFASRGLRGGILMSLLVTTLIAIFVGHASFSGVVSLPPSLSPTYLALDVGGAIDVGLLSVIFTFLFVDLFDTSTSLVAVAQRGGMLNTAGRFARFGRVLFSDASATIVSAIMGTSTTTTYVESTAGVAAGGRTGLTSVVVGGCFLVALFFYPLAQAVPLAAVSSIIFYVATLMLASLINVEWEDLTEAVPVVITAIIMPLTFSIANGIAFGFISYCVIKLAAGRYKQLNPMVLLITGFFIISFYFN